MAASTIQLHADPDVLLVVEIRTADDCVGTFSLTCRGDDRLQAGIAWQPEPPYRETIEVRLQRTARGAAPTEQVISGDAWRALEGNDLEDEFLDRVLKGADAQGLAFELLTPESTQPDGDLLISKVSSAHGFDDYDVKGHPKLHRLTVGHGIQKGGLFNLYCHDGRKVGGSWAGSLEASLKRSLKQLSKP